jgi:hypothetical protein
MQFWSVSVVDKYFNVTTSSNHVKLDLCHHGMVRPRVADRGDGLQIWRVAANIFNKQSRTADRGGPTAWGLVGG